MTEITTSECVTRIRQLLEESESYHEREKKENIFIKLLDYIDQMNFCGCGHERFDKVVYIMIIELYYYSASPDNFKQYLKYYMDRIFMINICDVKLFNGRISFN
jgi:hypothetical protein